MNPHPADTTDVQHLQGRSLPPEQAGAPDAELRPVTRQPFYFGRGPSYTAAVRWIAVEDEPGYLEPEDIQVESGVAVSLVADVYGRVPEQVAEDVARVRRQAIYDASESIRAEIG